MALGIRHDGKKEIIDFQLAASESGRRVGALPHRACTAAALTGEGLEMICVDGGKGLLAALPIVYHGIPVQRCWAHKIRNILNRVREADQEGRQG